MSLINWETYFMKNLSPNCLLVAGIVVNKVPTFTNNISYNL